MRSPRQTLGGLLPPLAPPWRLPVPEALRLVWKPRMVVPAAAAEAAAADERLLSRTRWRWLEGEYMGIWLSSSMVMDLASGDTPTSGAVLAANMAPSRWTDGMSMGREVAAPAPLLLPLLRARLAPPRRPCALRRS